MAEGGRKMVENDLGAGGEWLLGGVELTEQKVTLHHCNHR